MSRISPQRVQQPLRYFAKSSEAPCTAFWSGGTTLPEKISGGFGSAWKAAAKKSAICRNGCLVISAILCRIYMAAHWWAAQKIPQRSSTHKGAWQFFYDWQRLSLLASGAFSHREMRKCTSQSRENFRDGGSDALGQIEKSSSLVAGVLGCQRHFRRFCHWPDIAFRAGTG